MGGGGYLTRRGKKLNNFMDAHKLTDVFHALNPFAQRYTHFKRGQTLNRLDYVLASPSILTCVEDLKIGPAFRSDHSPLFLYLELTDEIRGRGFWRFPNFLVHNPQLRGPLIQLIQDIKLTNVNTEKGLLWDTVKAGIRGLSIKF